MDRIRIGLKKIMDAQNELTAAADVLGMLEEISEDRAQVVPLAALDGWGHGWYEQFTLGDDEDPPEHLMIECVWMSGYVLLNDGDGCVDYPNYIRKWYGRRGGPRIWDKKPSAEEMEATPWEK